MDSMLNGLSINYYLLIKWSLKLMKVLIKNVLVFVRNIISIISVLLWSTFAMAIPVNINQADAETIADALAGIGEKTAVKIVEYRKANGLFKAVEELTNIKGIGKKKLAKIKQDVKLK